MLKAKDQFIEFANYIFLVLLIIGAIFLVVTLGGVGFVVSLMQKLVPFSIVGFFLLVIAGISKKRSSAIKRGGIPEENINYFSALDRLECFLLTFFPPVLIYAVGRYFGGVLSPGDIAQMVSVFLVVNIWHLLLFNKSNLERVIFLTNRDESRDMMMICYISVIIFFFSDFNTTDWKVDVLQVSFSFGMLYLMHKFIFRKRVK